MHVRVHSCVSLSLCAHLCACTHSGVSTLIEVIPSVALVTGPQPPTNATTQLPDVVNSVCGLYLRVRVCTHKITRHTHSFPSSPARVLIGCFRGFCTFSRAFDPSFWRWMTCNGALCVCVCFLCVYVVFACVCRADQASLNLFSALCNDKSMRNVLFIGTFRDSNIGEHHPLTIALNSLKRTCPWTLLSLPLTGLSKHTLINLLADNLKSVLFVCLFVWWLSVCAQTLPYRARAN